MTKFRRRASDSFLQDPYSAPVVQRSQQLEEFRNNKLARFELEVGI